MLTIFTPTYNRAYILPRLYKSLCSQENRNFIWLIVDDGSTDNTHELIDKWIQEKIISIEYIKQENQGKHIAHNTGVDNCKTELFLCVDSDDYLLENAVQDVIISKNKIINDKICGIVTIKVAVNKQLMKAQLPSFIEYSSLCDLYEKYKFKGETALTFKADILKQYKFPKIEGEKFIGEDYIYSQIDENYNLYVCQDKYYVYEYLRDGYSKNIFKLIINNPKGYMILKKMKFDKSKNIKSKYKAAALYLVGCWLSGEKDYIKKSHTKAIIIASLPLALIVYCVRFKGLKELKK